MRHTEFGGMSDFNR